MQQLGQERAAGNKQKWIDREKMPDADVDVAGQRNCQVDSNRNDEPEKPAITSDESPHRPTKRGNRNQQERNRRLEREGDREVVPPAVIAILAEQRRRVTIVVVQLDVIDAEEVVSRNNLRQNANAGCNETQERRRPRLNPPHIRRCESRMLKVVSCVDEKKEDGRNQTAVNKNLRPLPWITPVNKQPDEQINCEDRQQHQHGKLCKQRHAESECKHKSAL